MLLFICLLMLLLPLSNADDSTCAVSSVSGSNDDGTQNQFTQDDDNECNPSKFSTLAKHSFLGHRQELTHSMYAAAELQCYRLYITDLGEEFVTTSEDFFRIQTFLYYSIKTCMDAKIGNLVATVPISNEAGGQLCCSIDDCLKMINYMNQSDFVQPYGGTDAVWSSDPTFDFNYINQTLLYVRAG